MMKVYTAVGGVYLTTSKLVGLAWTPSVGYIARFDDGYEVEIPYEAYLNLKALFETAPTAAV